VFLRNLYFFPCAQRLMLPLLTMTSAQSAAGNRGTHIILTRTPHDSFPTLRSCAPRCTNRLWTESRSPFIRHYIAESVQVNKDLNVL